jgi:hypothetical protein
VIAEYMKWSWGGWHLAKANCTSLEVDQWMSIDKREQTTSEVALSVGLISDAGAA